MWSHQIYFFAFQHFHDHISVEHDENPHTPNLTRIGSWWPEKWPHEYLISPTEVSANWPGHTCLESDQFTLISTRLIRYSCGHISGPMNWFPPNLGCGCFSSCSTDTWYPKRWNAKKTPVFCDVIVSVLYIIWFCWKFSLIMGAILKITFTKINKQQDCDAQLTCCQATFCNKADHWKNEM